MTIGIPSGVGDALPGDLWAVSRSVFNIRRGHIRFFPRRDFLSPKSRRRRTYVLGRFLGYISDNKHADTTARVNDLLYRDVGDGGR